MHSSKALFEVKLSPGGYNVSMSVHFPFTVDTVNYRKNYGFDSVLTLTVDAEDLKLNFILFALFNCTLPFHNCF